VLCIRPTYLTSFALITCPILNRWVVNTNQISQASLDDSDATLQTKRDPKTGEKIIVKKLGFLATVKKIYKKNGLAAFWRGLGPALVLVINPIIAYTTFEQLKNYIIARRFNTSKLRPVSSGITAKPAVSALSDLDNFLLGAVSQNEVKKTSKLLTDPVFNHHSSPSCLQRARHTLTWLSRSA
jgi:hypothetical protein